MWLIFNSNLIFHPPQQIRPNINNQKHKFRVNLIFRATVNLSLGIQEIVNLVMRLLILSGGHFVKSFLLVMCNVMSTRPRTNLLHSRWCEHMDLIPQRRICVIWSGEKMVSNSIPRALFIYFLEMLTQI